MNRQELRSDGRGAYVDVDPGTGRSMGVTGRLRRSDRDRQHRQMVQFRLVDRCSHRSDAMPFQRRRRRRFRHRRSGRRPRLHLSVGAAQFHRSAPRRVRRPRPATRRRRSRSTARWSAPRSAPTGLQRAAESEVFLRKRKHTLVRYHQPVVAADRAGSGADLREPPEPDLQRLCPGLHQDAGQLQQLQCAGVQQRHRGHLQRTSLPSACAGGAGACNGATVAACSFGTCGNSRPETCNGTFQTCPTAPQTCSGPFAQVCNLPGTQTCVSRRLHDQLRSARLQPAAARSGEHLLDHPELPEPGMHAGPGQMLDPDRPFLHIERQLRAAGRRLQRQRQGLHGAVRLRQHRPLQQPRQPLHVGQRLRGPRRTLQPQADADLLEQQRLPAVRLQQHRECLHLRGRLRHVQQPARSGLHLGRAMHDDQRRLQPEDLLRRHDRLRQRRSLRWRVGSCTAKACTSGAQLPVDQRRHLRAEDLSERHDRVHNDRRLWRQRVHAKSLRDRRRNARRPRDLQVRRPEDGNALQRSRPRPLPIYSA